MFNRCFCTYTEQAPLVCLATTSIEMNIFKGQFFCVQLELFETPSLGTASLVSFIVRVLR